MSTANRPFFSGLATAFTKPPATDDQVAETTSQHSDTHDPDNSDDDDSDSEEEAAGTVDLHQENVDIDFDVEKPSFKQVAEETKELVKLAQEYEQESKEPEPQKPAQPARSASFLSVVTKVQPGESLDSPTHSVIEEDESPDLLDVSSDVNRLDVDVSDLRENFDKLAANHNMLNGQMSAVEARIDGLDKRMAQLQTTMSDLAKSMNAYQTSTASAIAAVGRKHKIMNDKEISSMKTAVDPPEVVVHGDVSASAMSGQSEPKAKPKKIVNLADWGL